MFRFRTRAVTSSKQGLMADHGSQPSSPTQNQSGPISSFLGSPRFRQFITKGFNTHKMDQPESVMSPTSILDIKPSVASKNSFWYDKLQPKTTFLDQTFRETKQHCSWENLDNKGIGLAFIDHINIEENSPISKNNKPVLFGSKLKVQIPSFTQHSSLSPIESPESPGDFDMKTKDSHLPGAEPSKAKYSTQILTVGEMELSEDYTCVITHGPNPTTTHIFNDCIIQSYGSVPDKPNYEPHNFLSSCWSCKKGLDQTRDIYIYRGEKAFCSKECRYQEMLLDGEANEEADDPSGTYF